MVLSETFRLSLFLVVREGLGSAVRLGARGTSRLTYQLRLALEPECLEEPTATARENPRDGSGLDQRHSSCLWFQILGVETDSFLPDVQGNRRDLPRQRQACHPWLDAFG